MIDFETYIRAHAADFDTQEPAPGHEERFLARLDVTPLPAAAPVSGGSPRTRLSSFFRRLRPADLLRHPATWACALAACLAVLLILRPGDPFRRAGNDPAAIYLAYMDQVAEIYGQLPPEAGSDRDLTLQEMTEETDPLFTQLPDELSPRQRARILKEYYGELLAGARKLNNY